MGKRTGIIFNIQRYSLHDGAGIRTNIFFKGCPLRCIWCSNPESQTVAKEMCVTKSNCIGCMQCINRCEAKAITSSGWDPNKCVDCMKCETVCPTGARKFMGKEMTVEEVTQEVMKDWAFYQRSGGGVTFSGGEALSQPEFAYELAKALKDNLLHLAIETCGYAKWEKAEPVLRCMDEILFDIKHMDSAVHKKLTGVGNELILENAAKAALLGVKMVVRTPVIGGYNSDEDNIKKTAAFASKIGVTEMHLLPYHRFGESKYEKIGKSYECDAYTPDDAQMKALLNIVLSHGLKAQIGG